MAFGSLDGWRTRFLSLVDSNQPFQLSDQEGLPRWLVGTGINAWGPGNDGVLEMALASAKKVTLLALWNGKPIGDDKGGTARLVKSARDAGRIEVQIINTRESLLEANVIPMS